MLNNKKVRLMTKLAIYEKEDGKEDIRLGRYYRMDYVRYQLLKTIVAVTFGYLILVLLTILYYAEYLIAEAVNLDYATIGRTMLGIYLMLLFAFGGLACIGYTIKYNRSRKKLAKYYQMLKRVRKIYREEKELAAGREWSEGEDSYAEPFEEE